MKYKYLSLALIASLFYANVFAQPVLKTQRAAGGSDIENFSSMSLTRDGGVIAGGSSRSNISGEKTENSRGFDDFWVVKFDSLGAIEWDKTVGGNLNDGISSLQQAMDGGYILGGGSNSIISGEKTEKSRGGFDYWVVKLDSLGKKIWDKTFGGISDESFAAIQQTFDGGYIIGGSSDSKISGEKTENGRGSNDYWIVKIDSLGKKIWDKTIGGSGYELLTSVQQTKDSGFIIGGYSLSNMSGEKTENSRGDFDYWVVKIDNSGNIEWDKTIGGNSIEGLYSLQQTNDAGYILGGTSDSDISGEKTENSKGGNDFWIVKLDQLGKIQWDKTIGGSSAYEDLASLQQTNDGGYILGGTSDSKISGDKTEKSKGGNDFWVVKLDGSGNIEWDKTIGGSDADGIRSIKEATKDRYIAGGYSESGKTGDKKSISRGSLDFWIVALIYKPCSTLTANLSKNKRITVQPFNSKRSDFIAYPNPAKDILDIQIKGTAVITLINQSGKTLLTQRIENNGSMNVSLLPAGLYYLKNNATGEVKKLLISK